MGNILGTTEDDFQGISETIVSKVNSGCFAYLVCKGYAFVTYDITYCIYLFMYAHWGYTYKQRGKSIKIYKEMQVLSEEFGLPNIET